MVDTVERWNEASGAKFITLYTLRMKSAFAEASGCRSAKQSRDPLHFCSSLDRPLDDEDGDTLESLVPSHFDQYAAADERMYYEWLRDFMRGQLDRLPADQAGVLRLRFYEGRTRQEIDRESGSTGSARKAETAGLNALRRSKEILLLHNYVEGRTNYYFRVGAHSNRSPVEELAIKREQWAEEFKAGRA